MIPVNPSTGISQAIRDIRAEVDRGTCSDNEDDEADIIIQEKLSDDESDSDRGDEHSEHSERDEETRYPCGLCQQDVGVKCLGCEGGCDSWFHLSCVGMSDDEFTSLINNPNAYWECPNCTNGNDLPPFKACDVSANKAVWGTLEGVELYKAINDAYDEVIKWNRNLFMVPSGHAGQDFVVEVTKCINHFNKATPLEPVALKLALISFPLLLQKPSKKSKTRDHVRCLVERLVLWQTGNLEDLLRKGRVIQKKLLSSKHIEPDNTDKIFCRLMLQGKVSAALRWIGDHKSSVHICTTEIIAKLKCLHPSSKKSSNTATLNGPIDKVEGETYESIDADVIQQCIKRISGAAGPSGADAELWLRIHCTKQLSKRPAELCEAVADLAKKLASELVDPQALDAFNACRLIPLVKDIDGVRPIGIGEILHRIVAKAIVKSVKMDVVDATTPIQICSGIPSGVEAAAQCGLDNLEMKRLALT